jgi:hypothetical protein
MVVNGQRCELDELAPKTPDGLNPDEEITSWARYNFPCKLSKEIEGGFYSSNFKTVYGNSRRLAILPSKGGPAPTTNYDFVNVPEINQVSTNTAGENGALLKITGTGFTNDESKVSVTAGGLPCAVKESTINEITCEVGNGASISGALNVGGGGVTYQKFTNLGKATPELFRELLKGATPPTPVFSGRLGEVDMITGETNTFHYWSGVFVAPSTGAFRFFVNTGDRVAAFISTTDGGPVPATPTVRRTYGNSYRLPLRT